MAQYELSDAQWCVLDLLMRARAKGIHSLNRLELINVPTLPQAVILKVTWAALTMPKELVVWRGQHDFAITPEGMQVYNLRFDNQRPSVMADTVICLPGPTRLSS